MATKKKPTGSAKARTDEPVIDDENGEDIGHGLEIGDEVGDDEPLDDDIEDEIGDIGDDELADDELVDDELGDDELVDDELVDGAPEDVAARPVLPGVEDDDDDEDEADPDDVEASLDDILKDRLVIEDNETDDEDVVDVDDRGEGTSGVVPKRPDEFVCQSCFLVKHPSQIADPVRQLCRDCV